MKAYSQSNPGEKIGEVESLELKRDKCTGRVTRTSLTAECVLKEKKWVQVCGGEKVGIPCLLVIWLRRGQMLEAVRVWYILTTRLLHLGNLK